MLFSFFFSLFGNCQFIVNLYGVDIQNLFKYYRSENYMEKFMYMMRKMISIWIFDVSGIFVVNICNFSFNNPLQSFEFRVASLDLSKLHQIRFRFASYSCFLLICFRFDVFSLDQFVFKKIKFLSKILYFRF